MASNRDKGKAKAKKKAKDEGWLETIKTVFWAVVIALLVRTFAYEPFSIPSGSMLPGLLVGDYLFVSKFSYGYSRYSFPWSPNLFSGRIMANPPKRGDVVVFRLPPDPKVDYIKRVIGLPGDSIQVKEGRLYINGKIVDRRRVGQTVEYERDEESGRFGETLYQVYNETLPGGRVHLIYEQNDNYPGSDNTPEYIVPPGHYFMMGDNRDNSCDSRFSDKYNPGGNGPRCRQVVGFVPFENLIGRAEFIFFSSDGSAEIWEVWKWPFAIRFSRFLKGVR
ncbi:MAG: signal peptidase I [Rhodospirillaceae bacterium]|nr:signal peptidase I [Rhodospirillaceae bacterium]